MDNKSILLLVGIIFVGVVVLVAVFKGRRVEVKGQGMTLKVDGNDNGTVNPSIKVRNITAGRHVIAHDGTGKGIDADKVEAGQDVRLQARAELDPKDN